MSLIVLGSWVTVNYKKMRSEKRLTDTFKTVPFVSDPKTNYVYE
jgi:hypothetical protein